MGKKDGKSQKNRCSGSAVGRGGAAVIQGRRGNGVNGANGTNGANEANGLR